MICLAHDTPLRLWLACAGGFYLVLFALGFGVWWVGEWRALGRRGWP